MLSSAGATLQLSSGAKEEKVINLQGGCDETPFTLQLSSSEKKNKNKAVEDNVDG